MAAKPTTEPLALLTLAEVASQLRCHVRTVRRRINAGELRGYKIGGTAILVPAEDVTALLTACDITGTL